ncbi:unnamed protein product [Mytilus coruscus]|uniref:G-protein coupled receptors family 2 profile 2 domain-containing protein n=1 Tax=Mytilus coruscus TaxID=42192 RepID=A0A6J8ACX4_MYTCO|nr:unnamed protein product [Mytilus coruscus]
MYRYPTDVDFKEVYNLIEPFQDGYQKRILEKQLLYCPMVPLCNNLTRQDSYPNGTSPVVGSCCFPCSCQKNGILNNEQCPNTDVMLSTHRKTCIYPQYLTHGRTKIISKHSYYMISSCAPTFNNVSIIQKCTADQRKLDPFDISLYIPVSINSSNLLFKNKYCAICNSHTTNVMIPWSANLTCIFEPFDTISFSRSIMKEIAQSDDCNILFQSWNLTSHPETCDWGRYTVCNQTGSWEVYDKFIEDACNSYTSVYRANYRNIFCFLCNSNQTPYMGCDYWDLYERIKAIPTATFASLISFREEDQENTYHDCSDNEIFDSYEEKCREVVCPSMHYYNKQHNKCEGIFRYISDVFYQVYYKVTIQVDNVIPGGCSMNCVLYDYYTVDMAISLYVDDNIGSADCCHLSEFHYPNEIKNLTHHVYIIGVNILATDIHNQTMYIEALSSSIQVTFDDNSLVFEPISQKTLELIPDFTELDHYYDDYDDYRYDDAIDRCFAYHKTIKVVSHFFCPRIKLQFNEVQLSTSYLTMSNKKIAFELNSVIQIENDFLVCLDDRIISNNRSGESKSQNQKNDIEKILSLICSITSITSLTLTMLVYLLLKELRTLPGLQQLMLSFHLLVAHALYLFGMNATHNTALCVAIGLFTHYFWLGSVMWMHICTFDIFRVFYFRLNTRSNSNRMKLFKRYLLYSVSVCCLFLTINIVNFFVSDNSTLGYLGYGGDRCYITKTAMVLYTFAIPVGILILLNMILFCFVIIRIKTAPQVDSETKIDRPMLIIYTKISIVTGMTWIFGFLHQWTLIDALSYIFIILNASQGLFIFLSFGCSGIVRSRIRVKLFGQKTQNSHVSVTSVDKEISMTSRNVAD